MRPQCSAFGKMSQPVAKCFQALAITNRCRGAGAFGYPIEQSIKISLRGFSEGDFDHLLRAALRAS